MPFPHKKQEDSSWHGNPFAASRARHCGIVMKTREMQPEGLQHTPAGLKEKPGLVFTPANSTTTCKAGAYKDIPDKGVLHADNL